jgi:hypothetical protein
MIPGRIYGATHTLDWDCRLGPVTVRLERDSSEPEGGITAMLVEHTSDGLQMTSAWFPNADELARLAAGAPVHLTVVGAAHPPVAVRVGVPPSGEGPPT